VYVHAIADSLHVPFRQGSNANRTPPRLYRFLQCRSLQYPLTNKETHHFDLQLCRMSFFLVSFLVHNLAFLLSFSPLFSDSFQEAARFGKRSVKRRSQTGQLVCIFLHYNNLVIHKRYYNIET